MKLLRRTRDAQSQKHRFLRRVVRLCLMMMCFLTMSVALLAWHSGEQLSSATVTALMGGWCGELLMSLLKRKFEMADSEEKSGGEDSPAEREVDSI